jgi:hypothetical protein
MEINVYKQEWAQAEHGVEIYVVEGTYRGMYMNGLTKKVELAQKVIAGGRGSKEPAKQLARDLKNQHMIYRIN